MEWRLAAARHALQQGRPRMCLSLLSPLGHTLTSTTAAHAPVPAPGPQPGSQKPSPKLDPSMPGGAEGRGPSCATGGPGAGVPDGVAASEKRQLAQLTALARIQLATTRKDWRQLLGAEGEGAGEGDCTAEIKRRYRQLAAAVHPDKCSLPGAVHAFQQLQLEAQQLLEELDAEIGRAHV